MIVALGVTAVVLGLIYLVIGAVVANRRGYFKDLNNLDNLFSAVGEVLVWPLILAGVKITLK